MSKIAQLTDHHGAIDPRAFDADRPTRPYMDQYTASARAEKRLWQTDTPRYARGAHFGYTAHAHRRIVAVGRTSSPDSAAPGALFTLSEDDA